MNKKLLILPILLIIIFAVSCNKENNENTDGKNTVTATPDIIQDDSPDDAVSAAPTQDESITDKENEEYVFICLDQNNAPVKSVKIQICTEEVCMMQESDENGVVRYAGDLYQYDIHIYSVPKGYELVSEKDFKTEAKYGTFKIVFTEK
ncbi:MAG: hypothetical protein IK014_09650 [Lachnospiraceae bacterium]|nr:hypothetical protein [Lachnospiraceae bacterium]